jgi:hypothetical protein
MEHKVSSASFTPRLAAASSSSPAEPDDLAGSIEVTVDAAQRLVTYTIVGFLDAELARRLGERQTAAMAQLRCSANMHLTMIDISRCKIQPQDVIETFRGILADSRYQARKLAVVVGSSLAKMQIRRVLHRDTVTYVETAAEARRWLLSVAGCSAAPDRIAD